MNPEQPSETEETLDVPAMLAKQAESAHAETSDYNSPSVQSDFANGDAAQHTQKSSVKIEAKSGSLSQGFVGPDGKFLSDTDLIGTVFAQKYEILELIGKGGMSVVYKARHTAMNKIFAVKVLHVHLTDDEISLRRFKQEAQASSNLNHPNIVSVHDYGEGINEMPYLVMDYIEGVSLSELLKRSGALQLERFLSIMQQVASALVHAHSGGIVHRDLKPSNIMISQIDGKELARIVDFGIAKVLDQSSEGAQQLTQTGEVFGSPLYMSPEQCSGSPIDQRTDIYALGCVMYEAISGTLPHKGSSVIETMHRHVNEPPPPLVAPQVAEADKQKLEVMLLRCLAKLPEDRYQSIAEIESELRQLKMRTGSGVLNKFAGAWDLASAKRRAGKKTKLPLIIGALAACMLSVMVLLFGLYQADQQLKELARVRAVIDKISATQTAFLNLGETTRQYFSAILFQQAKIPSARKKYMRATAAIIKKLEEVDGSLELDGFGSKQDRVRWHEDLQRIPASANESIINLSNNVDGGIEPMWGSKNIEVVNHLSKVCEEGSEVLNDMTRQGSKLEKKAKRKFEASEQTVLIYSFICAVINGSVMMALSLNFIRGNPEMKRLAEQAAKLSRKRGEGSADGLDDVAELDSVLQELATALSEAEEREKALISKLQDQEKHSHDGTVSARFTSQQLSTKSKIPTPLTKTSPQSQTATDLLEPAPEDRTQPITFSTAEKEKVER